MNLGPLIKRLRVAGVAAARAKSDLLPHVWTEFGWLCMPNGEWWCRDTGASSFALCESELEALQQVSLWKLEREHRRQSVHIVSSKGGTALRLVR